MRVSGRELVRLTDGSKTVDVAALVARRERAVAGIGEPRRFFRHLEALGLEVVARAFPGHHPYVVAQRRRDLAHHRKTRRIDAVIVGDEDAQASPLVGQDFPPIDVRPFM